MSFARPRSNFSLILFLNHGFWWLFTASHLHIIGEFDFCQSLICQVLLDATIRVVSIVISVYSAEITDILTPHRADHIILNDTLFGNFNRFSWRINEEFIYKLEVIGVILYVLIKKENTLISCWTTSWRRTISLAIKIH